MKVQQKLAHPTLLSLVIKLAIICTLISCSSIRKEVKSTEQLIFNIEIENYIDFVDKDIIIFDFIPNEHIIRNLNGSSQISDYLSNEQIAYFKKNLESNIKKNPDIDLPDNYRMKNKIEINSDELSDIKRINLSRPVLSENKSIALLSYSYGYKGSMEGGIKIYRKLDGEWKYSASFHLWIE